MEERETTAPAYQSMRHSAGLPSDGMLSMEKKERKTTTVGDKKREENSGSILKSHRTPRLPKNRNSSCYETKCESNLFCCSKWCYESSSCYCLEYLVTLLKLALYSQLQNNSLLPLPEICLLL